MTGSNEELRARLPELPKGVAPVHVYDASVGNKWAPPCTDYYTADQMRDYAIAALARKEEGREAVEMSPEFTDSARAALSWVLWHHQGGNSDVGQPIRFALGMGAHEPLPDWRIAEAKQWAALTGRTHPAPPSAGEGDAEPVSMRQRADAWDAIVTLLDELDPEWWNGEGTGKDRAVASIRRLATPTPQSGEAAQAHALAELREAMDIADLTERDAALVSFFRTTGAAMGCHGDAMGWTPEQTARHYLSEAAK